MGDSQAAPRAVDPYRRAWTRAFWFLFLPIIGLLGYLSLNTPMGWDHLEYHYKVYKMGRWGLLPYRDFVEQNFLGIYFYHYLVLKVFGPSEFGFRLFDLLHFVFCLATIRYLFGSLFGSLAGEQGRRARDLSLMLVTANYFYLGWWWTGQREIFALPYMLWSLHFWRVSAVRQGRWRWGYAVAAGAVAAVAVTIKPYYGLYLPLFVVLNLVGNIPFALPLSTRFRHSVLAGAGYLAVLGVYFISLQLLGILSAWVNEGLPMALSTKEAGSPLWRNWQYLFYGGRFITWDHMAFHAGASVSALLFLGWTIIIRRELKRYAVLAFLFLGSAFLILYQATGEVMSHHTHFVIFRSILLSLVLVKVADWLAVRVSTWRAKRRSKTGKGGLRGPCTRWAGKWLGKVGAEGRFTSVHAGAYIGFVVGLCIALFLASHAVDRKARALLLGQIGIEQYKSISYQTRVREDKIVHYLREHIDPTHDRVMFFCWSYYAAFHAPVLHFSRFDNTTHFLIRGRSSLLRRQFTEELARDFVAHPPKVVVIRTDDTWWKQNTSFPNWTTSLEEIKQIKPIWQIIEHRYKTVLKFPGFQVMQRR